MDKSRLEILPKVWLDHRRAVFLEEESTLAVADLHLGYAWAHRYHGQLMPLQPNDALLERLLDLCDCYKPQSTVILGDILHQAVSVKEIADELSQLVKTLSRACSIRFVLGNHDRQFKSVLSNSVAIKLADSIELGRFLLLHGHDLPRRGKAEFIIIGHEHPAISLGDGIRAAKFPCFLVSEQLMVLPAFSNWAAGTNIRFYDLMSPLARRADFSKAVAICGTKLLPIPLR